MIKEINLFCLIEKYFLYILGKCYNIFVISLYVLYVICCKFFFFRKKFFIGDDYVGLIVFVII